MRLHRMSCYINSSIFIGSPSVKQLALASMVSFLMFTGCTSAPTTPSKVVYPGTSMVSNVPAVDNGYEDALLDEESLDELANLLEATDMTMVEDDQLAISQMGNLWQRLTKNFALNVDQHRYNQRVEAQRSWFVTRQDYINRLTARTSRYLYHTVREAEKRGIPTELALLPVIESSYDPNATSNASAAGLWQFIPSTGTMYGLAQTRTYDGRRDVIESTRAAYDFLSDLHNQFGSWELALAAYNAGPRRIQNAIDANRARGLPTDFWSLDLPSETMNYVPRFIAVAQVVQNPSEYGIYLPAIANRQHFRTAPVSHGVPLNAVSQVTGVSLEELEVLNPALRSQRVDIAGPARVVIPNKLGRQVDEQLSKLTAVGFVPSTNDAAYYEALKNRDDLADYAQNANAPVATIDLDSTATSKTNAAMIMAQEPPLRPDEIEYINAQVKQVEKTKPSEKELQEIQTQQSILKALNKEKQISYASTSNGSVKSKGKRSVYTVVRGDTLSNIASRAGLAWRDIADWNQIDPNDALLVGTTLYLYDAKPIKPLNTSSLQPVQTKTKAEPQSTAPTQYVVQSGDTLIGTALKFGLSPSELASYNDLTTKDDLVIGQKLWLTPNKMAAAANSRSDSYAGATQRYQVVAGDNLTKLAQKYDISLATLASMNNLQSNAQLQAGQWLNVPSGSQSTQSGAQSSKPVTTYKGETSRYIVQSGDTLLGLASKLKTSHSLIADLNNLPSNAQLYTGQKLNLPASPEKVNVLLYGKSVSYKVQGGDTLIGVADAFGVTVSQLAVANNLSTNAQLIRGSTLTIPSESAKVGSSAVQSSSANYVVQSGDTLIGLAKRFNVSVSQLAEANQISTDSQLLKGQKLAVPDLSTNMVKNSTGVAKDNVSNFTGSYTVKAGDTLTQLAQKFDVRLSKLAAANALSTNDELKIGQVIKVPSSSNESSSSVSSTANVASQQSSSASSRNSGTKHKVISGENLTLLARKYGMSLETLADANDLDTNAQLIIGQVLIIPATTMRYQVVSGDSLIGLARRYGVTTKELADLNGLAVDAGLRTGQVLIVPVN